MMEASKLEGMDSDNLSSYQGICELEEKGTKKISVSEQIHSLQYTNMKSDSFTVDMDRLSHLTNKDLTLNSRINLQRSLSRKGCQKGAEKKMNPSIDKEGDVGAVATSSPRAPLVGDTMPEKSMVVTVGTTDQAINPLVHHQITVLTDHVAAAITTTTTAATAAAANKSRLGGKRFSFRRSSSINPRRILFFFAALSSIGTILLIYFTLSIGKFTGDDNSLN